MVNKFLLVGDKFMPEMHLKVHFSKVHLLKIKKELKSLCKLEIQILFRKMNLIKLVVSMAWLMENQKI